MKNLFSKFCCCCDKSNAEIAQNFHELSATSLRGKEINMSDYKGKYILVVNTASKCGLTPQYEGLEAMYQEFKDKNFMILGFPCNQFGNQEPGDEKSIEEGCLINYGVSFQMFSKIEVNGANTHPIFAFLKSKKRGKIKWNFTKFLIDPEGNVIDRFSPITKPEKIASKLRNIL